MTTAALLLLHAVAALAGAGLWLAAGFTAGPNADRRTRSERMTVLALAAGGTIALLAAAVMTALLAGRGWWFAGDKVTVGIPFEIVGLAAGVVGLAWWLRGVRMTQART